jgi:hypothetical protein
MRQRPQRPVRGLLRSKEEGPGSADQGRSVPVESIQRRAASNSRSSRIPERETGAALSGCMLGTLMPALLTAAPGGPMRRSAIYTPDGDIGPPGPFATRQSADRIAVGPKTSRTRFNCARAVDLRTSAPIVNSGAGFRRLPRATHFTPSGLLNTLIVDESRAKQTMGL